MADNQEFYMEWHLLIVPGIEKLMQESAFRHEVQGQPKLA